MSAEDLQRLMNARQALQAQRPQAPQAPAPPGPSLDNMRQALQAQRPQAPQESQGGAQAQQFQAMNQAKPSAGTLETLLQQASLTVHTAANLLRKLSTNPWINSVDLTVQYPAGVTSLSIPHGLGRTMNGAVIVGLSTPTLSDITVRLPGNEAQKYLVLQSGAPLVAAVVVRIRAF